ncbi:hypothetical protein NQ314_005456 [Rhamnusium bicolor]|uniref:63 kDa sperm flagellar membrane protein n=1 Tax=Rhamnusium bicolor TaxID=1586634 RepID=A0AAV8ZIQ5_9CUCU|nr:hypothetical protein NQ314_005456 [Rhamnusium bicolor]
MDACMHIYSQRALEFYMTILLQNLTSNLIRKKWNLNENVINAKQFIKNTDYISPSRSDAVYVFPTESLISYTPIVSNSQEEYPRNSQEIIDEEILKESPTNNFRALYDENLRKQNAAPLQNNVKVFKISPQVRDITQENVINHKETNEHPVKENFTPSKVRPWDNLPTFTVRNEFSPSGLSFLGDFPDFDVNTERSKPTTTAERKAKLLFRAGLAKPNPRDFTSITYTGFADFTTTVGDTVIIFTPHTTDTVENVAEATTISVEPVLIQPTTTLLEPPVVTEIKTFLSQEPPMETHTVEGHKLEMKTILPTMVIDKTDRTREPKSQLVEEHVDMDAKSAVLAHEQGQENSSTSRSKSRLAFTPDIIQPSESQPAMLSTPSHEDIAKIFALLQAQAKQSTEPLNSPSTIFFDESKEETATKEVSGGATTIFFDDDAPIETSAVENTTPSQIVEELIITTEEVPTTNKISTEKLLETTEKLPETTQKLPTTHKHDITTNEILTTSENIISTIPIQETTPEMMSNEVDTDGPAEEDSDEEHEIIDVACTEGSQILPTTVYKTLTYLTTFFIPTDDSTTTSVKSNEVVSTEIGFQTVSCDDDISPSSVAEVVEPSSTPKTTTEQPLTEQPEQKITTSESSTEQISDEIIEKQATTEHWTTLEITTFNFPETTPQEITTERRHVTESEPETTEATTEDGDEVELIYKTLYTTYTYLTTYFQESTSSIASRIVVTTNVITSTLDPGSEATDPAVAGLFEREDSLVSTYKSKTVSFEDIADIAPTTIDVGNPSSVYTLKENNDNDENNVDESEFAKPTPVLDSEKILQTANGIKTYYTTYTYFTTIFVDGETEISSRTEVYTNYVTPTIQASVSARDITHTKLVSLQEGIKNHLDLPNEDEDDEEAEIRRKISNLNVSPQNSYNTINRHKTVVLDDATEKENDIYASVHFKLDNNIVTTPSVKEQEYVTLQRGGTTTEDKEITESSVLNLNEYETISTMVTDVRSSTSEGDRRIIDNVDKRNVLNEDQIVSESNNDSEIIPSPTLLLQTSYTTFTYFTTMYHGTTSSNVVSRLETITNVVTQTLTPTHTLSVEDLSLPVTYFTTFTYWTTLFKNGTTKVTSREETVSNVVTPSIEATISPSISITPIVTTPVADEISPTESSENIIPSTVGDDDLTTYFTTYTYFTTSYVGNSTVLNSRLETVTNVLNNSIDIDLNQITKATGSGETNQLEDVIEKTKIEPTSLSSTLKPTGLLSTIVNTEENEGTTTIHSTDVYGTYIDGLYAKVLESTSSIITETISPSSVIIENLKPTGVVSINKGKIVDAEGVSTLFYTTQAVGTYIDNLYAQVIESTSSLTVDEEKKAALPTDLPIAHRTGLVRLIEGSIIQNDTTTLYESKVLGTIIDGRYAQIIESTSSFLVGSQASIKPSSVASEIIPSPTQAPDQQIAATDTISPSPVVIEGSISDSTKNEEEDSTEENGEEEDDDKDNSRVKSRLTFQSRKRTFTPAIRPFASRQRPTFAPKRKQSGQSTAATITRSDFTPTVTAVPASKPNRFGGRRTSTGAHVVQPTASGGRRFSRPKSTSAIGGSSSSSFGGGRRGSSARIQPTASGFGSSSRRGGFRSSSAGGSVRSSSLFGARPRIRPTIVSGLSRSPSSNVVTLASIEDENDLTTLVTDNPTDSFGEDGETTLALQTTTEGSSRRSQNPLLRFRRPPVARPTQASRTASTRQGKSVSYNRPSSLLNRPRPNALFPRRGLFTTTSTAPPEEEEEGEEDMEDLEEEGDAEEDTDYDSSLTNTQTANPPTTPPTKRSGRSSNVQIKPFFRRRAKRDTYTRFRRPTGRTTAAPPASYEDIETDPPKTAVRGRFAPKNRGKPTHTTNAPTTRKRISPSKVSTQGRSQFTLREKDTSPATRSNFKRPKTTARTTRPTAASRPKAPRLRNNYQTEATVNHRKPTTNNRQSSRTNSGRGRNHNSRSRYQKDEQPEQDNFVIPPFDGTITVTHQIPTEVTIPVVNGKITEYRNVVSALHSTEILDPRQYSTTINAIGKEIKVLLSENTAVGNNGATLITQFILHETPTTSVIFTPTFINRRKTSFSHVIPSTIYEVEQVVNTIQPALAAQAPLANILLSQLLLGGLQPQTNPLLGLQQQALPALPATPTTEYKTRTTTYVTTVTSETSTVIPLTFRGKEILTTIIDSSVSVITATEFLTDTVVVTPTLGYPVAPQLNTALLLPLLQQQLQQQSPSPLLPQQPANVFNLNEQPHAQALYQEPEKFNLAIDDSSEFQDAEEATPAPRRKSSRKNKKNKPAPIAPPRETSIVTLYVSGRTPGEFTTVLSTVTIGEENNRRKREVPYIPVKPSIVANDHLTLRTRDFFDDYVMPTTKEVQLQASENTKETESLESIIGDVTKYLTTQTPELFNIKPTKSTSASKKYKIKYVKASEENKKSSDDFFSVSDLSKVAPRMPKVETSLNLGGQLSITKSDSNNHVSNNTGSGVDVNLDFKIGNCDTTKLIFRIKRDSNNSGDVIDTPHLQRKRVVKKAREKASELDTTTKRVRRRLLIKKKKKRLLTNLNSKNFDSDDHLPQVNKSMKKLIITRKRLLPKSSKSQTINSQNVVIDPFKLMTTVMESTIQSYKQNFEDHGIDDVTEKKCYVDIGVANNTNSTNGVTTHKDETNQNELILEEIGGNDEYKTDETKLEEYENATEENLVDDYDTTEINDQPTFQDIPEYEPFFPELSESLDAPVLLLRTTILSSIELVTKTVVQSRLRTYTFVVTRVNGDEQIITSTTEVKPQTKTSILTEPYTKFTTLTLLDFDATQTLTELQKTIIPTLDNPQPQLLNQDNAGRGYEEARYNLATRIMSNGVEVIVAGDKSTLPGEPDIRRVLSSSSFKPVTLKPSTLTDHMVMMLPQDASNIETLTSSLYPSQFVTKTCLTTFTYLTTYLEGSTTTVSSHEQIVSNIATEERNTGKILPTPAMGITLTQYPNLSVGVFHTTYTYLNTILDGEQPLVVSSKHTVTNTVTAPDNYLSFLKPSETISAIKDTNTYYSTVALEKTLYDGDKSSVVSTNEVVTQVVITESIPPRATSVMTSYIALDMEHPNTSSLSYTTTDVVKTYFVTYTYYNTITENGKPVINTNISTSSDVVTEKLYLYPKKTVNNILNTTPTANAEKKKHKIDLSGENFHILATKSYFTTFTHFTTLLQEDNLETPTVISSRTRVIENIVTETIDHNLLDKKYLNILRNEFKEGSNSITKLATLQDGQKLEIIAIANENKEKIKPTKVLPIEKTNVPDTTIISEKLNLVSSTPSVITGSTIIFVDDDPFAQLATPTLTSESKTATSSIKNNLGSLLSSEIVKNTKISTAVNKSKRSTKTKLKTQANVIRPTSTKSVNQQNTSTNKLKVQTNQATKIAKPVAPAADLLGLGSININSLQALTPVLNAMAGLIKTNLKSNRRNDANITTTTTPKTKLNPKTDNHFVPAADIQNRSPIYIPVGGLTDDFEIAESQNIATFDWVDPPSKDQMPGKTTHETPLLNGGIPISPGEVITANSDVIVGKPGRIGPRIPSIPLNQVKTEDDIPIGMKPPPIPNKIWLKKNHEYKHIPVANIRNDKPLPNVIHAPNKHDYVGPPPPLQGQEENVRGDKRKHIPLRPLRKEVRPYYEAEHYNHNIKYGHNNEIPLNHHTYASQNLNNYGTIYTTNEHSYPMYAQDQSSLIVPGIPINDFNIQPSVINEPIVMPEVIERSTGQPLLVNIQPSQVAFVNIPFNRTTALIYGGSTEPHKNGQYFDDPSPYPEPEFSGIEFNNGVPHVASVYHDEPLNQKQVNGVFKQNIKPTKPHNDAQVAFGSNHEISINVPPISFGLMHQDNDFNAHVINHGDIEFRPPATPYEVTIDQENIGPPSYQEIPQIVNKPENNRRPIHDMSISQNYNRRPTNKDRPVDHHFSHHEENPNSRPNNGRPNFLQQGQASDLRPSEKRPVHQHNPNNSPQSNDISNDLPIRRPEVLYTNPSLDGNKSYQNKHKYPNAPKKNNLRPRPPRPERPNLEISEYMTPPPFNRNTLPKHPYLQRPSSKRPLHIPLSPDHQHNYGQTYSIQQQSPQDSFGVPYNPHLIHQQGSQIPMHNTISLHQSQNIPEENKNTVASLPNNFQMYSTHDTHKEDISSYSNSELDIGNHRDDDLANEEGEVIQESNTRPLLPGEVPFEILKAKASTTTEHGLLKTNNSIRFPNEEQLNLPNNNNEFINHEPPLISQNARPFATNKPSVIIKPETSSSLPQIPISRPQNPIVRPENQQTNQINNFDVDVNQFNQSESFNNYYSSTERSNVYAVGNNYNANTDSFNKNVTQKHKNSNNRFVTVGSQFENIGNQQFVVSGNQFTNILGQVHKNQETINHNKVKDEDNDATYPRPEGNTSKPNSDIFKPTKVVSQNYPTFTENTISSVFGFKTKNPISIYKPKIITSTTQKPIIIYIDDTVENKDEFFHHNNHQNKIKPHHDRPSVTSLPIDTQTIKSLEISYRNYSHNININTQTEKPFIPQQKPSHSSNQVNIISDVVTSERPIFTTRQTTSFPTPEITHDLNTGEITVTYTNDTTEFLDMEVMKPPPLVSDLPVKQPDTEMQPPKLETDTHNGDILKVPSLQTESPFLENHTSNPKPYIPNPLEEMAPPPQSTTDEEVLGMSPPPVVSTHKSVITIKPVTSNPVFSMEVDIPKEVPIVFKPSTSTSTEKYNRFTRPRRPYTRRPGYYRTSTPTPTITSTTPIHRRPNYPLYKVIHRNISTTNYVDENTTTEKIITPSPTFKTKPSIDIIIGHPNLNIDESEPSTPTTPNHDNKNDIELTGSEVPIKESTTEKTVVLNTEHSELLPSESGIPTVTHSVQSLEPSRKKDIITQAVHHAGNEVKVVDENVSSVDTTTRKALSTISKDNKSIIPTRYITYTKTSTVTITKTTVVKTLGGPPSTLTILVTKTEKSTIVDTVTEFHTLVKPTNIIETITTTIQQGSSLYPADVYGSTYPSIQVRPSMVTPIVEETISGFDEESSEEDLEDFIISETDPPGAEEKQEEINNSDTILVVLTDKNTKGIITVPNNSYETQERDEVIANNEVNNVLLAGILSANHPSPDVPEAKVTDKCEPECKASRNELCQKVEGMMRCVCRPGFARMFPDRPCLPTYTYNLRITLDRIDKDKLQYYNDLSNSNSTEFLKFAQTIHEALDRMVMQSDLRDIFHGVEVHSFKPSPTSKGIVTRFYLQLSDNIDETRLEEIFKKYFRNNNYSLGGTDIFTSPQSLDELKAQDFDECSYPKFHDCSENAQCFNLKGTYTCSCREGFSDLSENILYPGRICSAEQIGCERCNYHGTCYSREGDDVLCECFQWYTGESCHINLKVLLIALVTLGTVLFALLLICIILTCVRRKPRKAGVASGMSFLPQRVGNSGNRGTLDRRAMIQDTSSEDSRSETNTLPYIQQKMEEIHLPSPTKKDRSLTVMIPRAKYHPAPPTSPLVNYTSFDARKPSVPSVTEAKLLSYLDAGPSPNKSESKRKFSNTPSESYIEEQPNSRKTSGALVSAGFEVSATVVNNMGTLGTTCGTEADRSENATLIQKISADLLSSTGTRSQFNTLRKSLVDDDIDSSSNWLDIVPRVT